MFDFNKMAKIKDVSSYSQKKKPLFFAFLAVSLALHGGGLLGSLNPNQILATKHLNIEQPLNDSDSPNLPSLFSSIALDLKHQPFLLKEFPFKPSFLYRKTPIKTSQNLINQIGKHFSKDRAFYVNSPFSSQTQNASSRFTPSYEKRDKEIFDREHLYFFHHSSSPPKKLPQLNIPKIQLETLSSEPSAPLKFSFSVNMFTGHTFFSSIAPIDLSPILATVEKPSFFPRQEEITPLLLPPIKDFPNSPSSKYEETKILFEPIKQKDLESPSFQTLTPPKSSLAVQTSIGNLFFSTIPPIDLSPIAEEANSPSLYLYREEVKPLAKFPLKPLDPSPILVTKTPSPLFEPIKQKDLKSLSFQTLTPPKSSLAVQTAIGNLFFSTIPPIDLSPIEEEGSSPSLDLYREEVKPLAKFPLKPLDPSPILVTKTPFMPFQFIEKREPSLLILSSHLPCRSDLKERDWTSQSELPTRKLLSSYQTKVSNHLKWASFSIKKEGAKSPLQHLLAHIFDASKTKTASIHPTSNQRESLSFFLFRNRFFAQTPKEKPLSSTLFPELEELPTHSNLSLLQKLTPPQLSPHLLKTTPEAVLLSSLSSCKMPLPQKETTERKTRRKHLLKKRISEIEFPLTAIPFHPTTENVEREKRFKESPLFEKLPSFAWDTRVNLIEKNGLHTSLLTSSTLPLFSPKEETIAIIDKKNHPTSKSLNAQIKETPSFMTLITHNSFHDFPIGNKEIGIVNSQVNWANKFLRPLASLPTKETWGVTLEMPEPSQSSTILEKLSLILKESPPSPFSFKNRLMPLNSSPFCHLFPIKETPMSITTKKRESKLNKTAIEPFSELAKKPLNLDLLPLEHRYDPSILVEKHLPSLQESALILLSFQASPSMLNMTIPSPPSSTKLTFALKEDPWGPSTLSILPGSIQKKGRLSQIAISPKTSLNQSDVETWLSFLPPSKKIIDTRQRAQIESSEIELGSFPSEIREELLSKATSQAKAFIQKDQEALAQKDLLNMSPSKPFKGLHDKETRAINEANRTTQNYLAEIPAPSNLETISFDNEFKTTVTYVRKSDQTGYHFAVKIQPSHKFYVTSPKQHFIFILDGSRSIKKNRYNTFKQALIKSLSYMQRGDSFNLLIADSKISTMSQNPMTWNKGAIKKTQSYLNGLSYRGFFANYDPFYILSKATDYFVSDKENVIIFMTDGQALENIKKHQEAFKELSKINQGRFSLFTACVSKNNRLAMLDLISTLNHGEIMYSQTHAAFPRKLAVLVKHIESCIAKNIRIHTTDAKQGTNIEFYPNQEAFPSLFADRPYTIYGSTNHLEDFDLILQGRSGDQWVNIRQHISFKEAERGGHQLKRHFAQQQAYTCYDYYLKKNDPFFLAEAERILHPYALPPATR